MAYLYRHIRLDKNEPFYIGIGNDNLGKHERANDYLNRNKYWKNIINKTNYKIDILLDDISWEEACEKEIFFISYYGRKDLNKGSLVNMTNGGEGTKGPKSEEHKQKIGLAHLGQKRSIDHILKMKKPKPVGFGDKLKKTNPSKGNRKPKTDTWKLKISKAIIQYDSNGKFIREYESCTIATQITNIKGIANVLTSRTKTAGGYVWRYKLNNHE